MNILVRALSVSVIFFIFTFFFDHPAVNWPYAYAVVSITFFCLFFLVKSSDKNFLVWSSIATVMMALGVYTVFVTPLQTGPELFRVVCLVFGLGIVFSSLGIEKGKEQDSVACLLLIALLSGLIEITVLNESLQWTLFSVTFMATVTVGVYFVVIYRDVVLKPVKWLFMIND